MAFTLITVTRTYKTPSNHPAQGYVQFTPNSPMVNGTTTISAPETVYLSKTGAISIVLAANNDPGTLPVGTSYTVREVLDGQDAHTYNVIIPYNAAGGTVGLSTLAPVANVAPAVPYVSSVNGQSGAVTVAPTPSDATTSTKGIARILGGTADAPTVPWASLTGVATVLTRLAAAPVTITYAASITPNASQSCVFYCTATGDITLAGISNGIDGQSVYVQVTASGGARTLSITGISYSISIPSGEIWGGLFRYDAGAADFVFIDAGGAGSGAIPGVTSVNGKSGPSVTLTPDDFTDATTNHVFTAADDTKLGGIATGATANSPDATLLARANHTGTQSADTLTDGTTNKAFLTTERTKLTGIATSATANSSDATLLARANHTGSQTASTISDFTEAAQDVAATMLTGGTHTGITATYVDASNRLDLAVTGSVTGITSGSSADPNGTVTGSPGDIYRSTSGTVGAGLWVKETGAATTTGWLALAPITSAGPAAVQPYLLEDTSTTGTPTSGSFYATTFVADRSLTASNILLPVTTAMAGGTLFRAGLYTVTSSDVGTLVARTSGNISDISTTGLLSVAFNTTGGYPATYDIAAGQRYALGLIRVGGTTAPVFRQKNLGVTPAIGVAAYGYRRATVSSGQTDCPTGFTGSDPWSNQLYWLGLT